MIKEDVERLPTDRVLMNKDVADLNKWSFTECLQLEECLLTAIQLQWMDPAVTIHTMR